MTQPGPVDATKTCPMCAEEVKAAATICRFCGHNFTDEKAPAIPPSTTNRTTAVMVIVGLIAAAVVIGIISGSGGEEEQVSDAESRARLEATLKNAATAEESYLTTSTSYTTNVTALENEGLQIPPDVTVTIPSASATGYCIQAEQADLTMHYSSETSRPLEGPCPTG